MTRADPSAPPVPALRLAAQRLTGEPFSVPEVAVRGLVAVQAQDYAGAKWALSLRTGADEARLDALFDAGRILRTHVLRPTWHFVDPTDIRWLLELTGPRVKQAMASFNRKVGFDAATFRKSARLLEKALRDRNFRTRAQLADALRRGGIDAGAEGGGPAGGGRLSLLMMYAEADGLICSGPREGKQFTYALLEERAPAAGAGARTREEALAELAKRYVIGHGPAQVGDFAWWSGLTLSDARRGLAGAGKKLATSTLEGKTYWHSVENDPTAARKKMGAPVVHLLPNYDEAFIAFKDRSAFHARLEDLKEKPRKGLFDRHILFIDGQVAGGWSRAPGRKAAPIVVEAVGKLGAAEKAAAAKEAKRHTAFLGEDVSVEFR